MDPAKQIMLSCIMSTTHIQQWCASTTGRLAIDHLLQSAASHFPQTPARLLQIQGEPIKAQDGWKHLCLFTAKTPSPPHQTAIIASPEQLPFPPETFDMLILMFPSEDFGDPNLWVRECQRVMRQDGVILWFSINPLSLAGLGEQLGLNHPPKSYSSADIDENLLNPWKMQTCHHAFLPWFPPKQAPRPSFKKADPTKEPMMDWPTGDVTLEILKTPWLEEIAILAEASS